MIRSNPGQTGETVPTPSDEVLEIHERMLATSAARSRHIELRSGRRVHVIEAGQGSPVLFLHGSSTSSLSLLPLIEHLDGVQAIAVDRPGFGLSEPVLVPRERFRNAAVEFIDEVVGALGLGTPTFAGNSMGGTWGLWYALAHTDRARGLVLLGSAPLLPGTRAPLPLRVSTTPVVGDLLSRVVKINPKMVVRLMSAMGESDTIVRYPDLLEAVAAAGNDPTASAVNLAELRAVITPFGFRPSLRLHPDDLRRLTVPTLLIWGDNDPVGAVKAAQTAAGLIPEAQLQTLPGGHVPYLGNPERVSELLSGFVRSVSNPSPA